MKDNTFIVSINEWRDVRYGNTYHGIGIKVNGTLHTVSDYGFGNQYKVTAKNLMERLGIKAYNLEYREVKKVKTKKSLEIFR